LTIWKKEKMNTIGAKKMKFTYPFYNYAIFLVAFKTWRNYSTQAIDVDFSGRKILLNYSRNYDET